MSPYDGYIEVNIGKQSGRDNCFKVAQVIL